MWDLHRRGDAGFVRGGSSRDWWLLGPFRRAKVLQEKPPEVSCVSRAGQGRGGPRYLEERGRAGLTGRGVDAHVYVIALCDVMPWLRKRERHAQNASVTVPLVEFVRGRQSHNHTVSFTSVPTAAVYGFLLCLRRFG